VRRRIKVSTEGGIKTTFEEERKVGRKRRFERIDMLEQSLTVLAIGPQALRGGYWSMNALSHFCASTWSSRRRGSSLEHRSQAASSEMSPEPFSFFRLPRFCSDSHESRTLITPSAAEEPGCHASQMMRWAEEMTRFSLPLRKCPFEESVAKRSALECLSSFLDTK
jgi:hypothetical protein